jgi:UDP-N-acetylglucosamine acyltransferase
VYKRQVIPYGIALGNRAYLGGLNIVGMKRAGISRESIHNARNAFKHIFSGEQTVQAAASSIDAELAKDPVVAEILDFLKSNQDRALCTPR